MPFVFKFSMIKKPIRSVFFKNVHFCCCLPDFLLFFAQKNTKLKKFSDLIYEA